MYEIEKGDIVCCKITGRHYLVTDVKDSFVYAVRYGEQSAQSKRLVYISIKNKEVAEWMRQAFISPKPSILKRITNTINPFFWKRALSFVRKR